MIRISDDTIKSNNSKSKLVYLERIGLLLIPVEGRSKRPVRKNWQNHPESAAWFEVNPGHNVGVLLGSASDGVVDIDLDDPIARRLASRILPPTGMVFGRLSNPSSHYIYRVEDDPGGTQQFQFSNHGMLCEYRSDGAQTVFPPSIHESGEEIEFVSMGDPGEVTREVLINAVGRLAAATVLAKLWAEGSRHDLALALSGALLNAKWDQDDVSNFIDAICYGADDDERADRIGGVRGTVRKLHRNEPVTGWPTLAGIIGEEAARKVAEWLEVEFSDRDHSSELVEANAFKLPEGASPYTELSNAKRFCRQHQQDCFFHSGLRKWFVWDGRRWTSSTAGTIEKMGHETVESMGIEAAKNGQEAMRWAANSCSSKGVDAMLKMAQPYLSKSARVLDRKPYLLNCLNGTLDLRTGSLEHITNPT